MSFHQLVFCLAFCLVLIPAPSSHAQSQQTQDWETWNAASKPLFPGEHWMQYETPDEAGWSSEKLASAKRMSDRAGSTAVMIIYDGAVLKQWGQVERIVGCYSIRKSLLIWSAKSWSYVV